MATPRAAWGIDLGNRALKAIKLAVVGEQIRVEDFEVVEHEQILSAAGDNREGLMQSALAAFTQRHDIKNSPVAVGVSGQSSFARFIQLPPVEDRKIPEIVRFEAIQQIPFPLDDVEWAYQLFRQPESPDVEVGIFAMRKELVNRQIQYFTDLGMNVQVVQMIPLAVYNAVHHDQRINGTTMFMDSGAENTDLIIADGETVWLRTLPIGGNSFTEALAKAFKLNFAKAEELKRNAATSKYAKQIFQAMRPVFADLVAEAQRSIGFYASVHRDARIQRIVALGGTFRLPGLQKYLQQHLQLDVSRIDAFRAMPAEGKAATSFAENVLSMAGAYGLALQAIDRSKIVSSLLPAAIRRAKMWQEKSKWFGLAAAVFVAGTCAVATRYFVDQWSFDKNAEVRSKIAQVKQQAERYSRDWQSIQGTGEPDRNQILRIGSLAQYRDLWPTILADLKEAIPSYDKGTPPPAIRGQRRQVILETLSCRYVPSIGDIIDEQKTPDEAFTRLVDTAGAGTGPVPGGDGMGGGADFEDQAWRGGGGPRAAAAAPTAQRGFLLLLRGYTPHVNGPQLVHTELTQKLRQVASLETAQNKNKPYYVARLKVANVGRREPARTTPGGGAAPRPPMWDEDVGMGVPGQPGQPAGAIDPTIDRMTNESLTADTEFTLLLALVLDPPRPVAETAKGPTY